MNSKIPDTAITIRTYADLSQFATRFAEGRINLLGVVGTGGLSKTQTFSAAMAETDHLLVKGHSTAFGLYLSLYEHVDEPVILDDADTMYGDKPTKPLLKALCETTPTKIVGWNTKAADKEGVPRRFQTRSRVAVLANEWATFCKTADMRAVTDRGQWLNFVPSVQEVHRQVRRWFTDGEIYEFVGKHLHLITTPSMRHYVKAKELRDARISDWQDKCLAMLNPTLDLKALEVASDLMAKKHMTAASRVEDFFRRTGLSRATFFNYQKLLADRSETA